MKYSRIFATADGESHFEDVGVPLEVTQLVPGRPEVEVGPAIPTSAATFLHLGADWDGTTSDGETRRFGPGSIYLLDDATGKGHYSRVTGGGDWFGVGVDLVQPERADGEAEKTIVARLMDEVINQKGHPATGKSFEFSAMYLWQLDDGKLSELFQESDRVRLMQQLGLLER